MHQRSSRSYPSCSCSFAVSSATNISYSSEAYLSQSEGSGPSLSMSWTSRNTQFYRHTCNLEEVLLSLIFPHRKCDHILMVLIVKQWKKKNPCQGCQVLPFAQQMGLSARGPGISPGWKKCRRICEPSGSALDRRGLSSLGKEQSSAWMFTCRQDRKYSEKALKVLCRLILCCTNLGSLVWPSQASGRADPGRAGVRCPSSPSSHTVPHRNTPAHTWTGRRRRRCPCSGTSTRCWREKTQTQRERLGWVTFSRLAA